MDLSHSNKGEINSLNKQEHASVKPQELAEASIMHKCSGNKAINKRKLSHISNQQLAVKICNIFLKLSKITLKLPRFKFFCRGILWPYKPRKNSPVAWQVHPHPSSCTKTTSGEKQFKFLFTPFAFCTWLSLRNINIITTTPFPSSAISSTLRFSWSGSTWHIKLCRESPCPNQVLIKFWKFSYQAVLLNNFNFIKSITQCCV